MLDALSLLTPEVFLFICVGVVAGLIVGIMPGMGGPTGIALLLPFTLAMDPAPALAMICGLMAANAGSDSIPSILFGIPGGAASQATVLDGYPMARKGMAGRALGAAYSSSLLGGLLSAVILSGIIMVARPFVLAIGSPELLMLGALGIVMTAMLSGKSPVKGLISGTLGVLVAIIGVHLSTGVPRWTGGSTYLFDGIPIVIIGLGLFALPEIIDLMAKGTPVSQTDTPVKGVWDGIRDTLNNKFLLVRTGILGTVVGMVPGLGGGATDWFAYAHARSTEKGAHETFGKGDVRGVIGIEGATAAKDAGGLVPTLLFGVPGNVTGAMVLVVFIIQGIEPGPQMLSPDFIGITYLMVWSLVAAYAVSTILCMSFTPIISKLAFIPGAVISPVVIIFLAFAAIGESASVLDMVTMVVLGFLGWVMKRIRWPRPAFVIGFVLGPIIEKYLFISTQRYQWEWLTNTGVLIIAALIFATIAYEVRVSRRRGRQLVRQGEGGRNA